MQAKHHSGIIVVDKPPNISSAKVVAKVKRLLYSDPKAAHRLLGKLADTVTDYLNAQIEAGAQAVQIFDTWGGTLSPALFTEFSMQYLARIVAGLHRSYDGQRIPVVLFCKGCNAHLEALATTGCDALGVDWTITLAEARERVGDKVALQGNLDPAVLLSDPDVIRQQVEATLDSYGAGHGHVFNLGHGITPDVPPEHLGALIEHLHRTSPRYHG
mgnify:CR=1 FL=1